MKCFFWHISTLFKVLCLVVSTQTNHMCHITYLNWEIIYSLLRFFSSLSPCWFFICGGEWGKPIIHCTIQWYFWCTQLRSDARCVIGQDYQDRFWVGRLTHHCLIAGLLVLMQDWAFLFRCLVYWTDWTHQNSCVISMELCSKNKLIWAVTHSKVHILVLSANPFFSTLTQ